MKNNRISLRHWSTRRFLKSRTALGAPVGNLIILVAAVVLSSTVVLFATNVTSDQVQKESLSITKVVLDTETAVITLENTGPTSISVTQITIKGEKISFSDTSVTSSPTISAGLTKGDTSVITVTLPTDLISDNDVGRPITLIITTSQCAYFTETLAQAAT
jgi:hypothetical protein